MAMCAVVDARPSRFSSSATSPGHKHEDPLASGNGAIAAGPASWALPERLPAFTEVVAKMSRLNMTRAKAARHWQAEDAVGMTSPT